LDYVKTLQFQHILAYHRTTLHLSSVILVLLVEEHCHVQKKGKIIVSYILIFIFPDCRGYEEDYKILYQIALRTSALKFLLTPAYMKF